MAKNDWKWLKMTSNEKNKITLLSSTLKVTIIKWSPFLDLGTLKGRYCNFLIFHLFYYIALLYKFQDLGGKGKLTPIELKFFVWTSIGVYQYQKKNEKDSWQKGQKNHPNQGFKNYEFFTYDIQLGALSNDIRLGALSNRLHRKNLSHRQSQIEREKEKERVREIVSDITR